MKCLPCCYIPPRSCPERAESVYQAGRSSSWRKPSTEPRIYKSLSSYRAETSLPQIRQERGQKVCFLTSILLERAVRKLLDTKMSRVGVFFQTKAAVRNKHREQRISTAAKLHEHRPLFHTHSTN